MSAGHHAVGRRSKIGHLTLTSKRGCHRQAGSERQGTLTDPRTSKEAESVDWLAIWLTTKSWQSIGSARRKATWASRCAPLKIPAIETKRDLLRRLGRTSSATRPDIGVSLRQQPGEKIAQSARRRLPVTSIPRATGFRPAAPASGLEVDRTDTLKKVGLSNRPCRSTALVRTNPCSPAGRAVSSGSCRITLRCRLRASAPGSRCVRCSKSSPPSQWSMFTCPRPRAHRHHAARPTGEGTQDVAQALENRTSHSVQTPNDREREDCLPLARSK